jgi:hypothetical protein
MHLLIPCECQLTALSKRHANVWILDFCLCDSVGTSRLFLLRDMRRPPTGKGDTRRYLRSHVRRRVMVPQCKIPFPSAYPACSDESFRISASTVETDRGHAWRPPRTLLDLWFEASIYLILTVVTIVKWDCHGLSLRPVLDERDIILRQLRQDRNSTKR